MKRIMGITLLVAAAPLLAQAELVTDFIEATNTVSTNVLMGAVGVGTDTPSAKLHVAGDMRVEGAMVIPRQGDVLMGSYTNGLSGDGTLFTSPLTNVLVKAHLSANTSIARQIWKTVPYDVVTVDTEDAFNTTTHQFTVPKDGTYLMHARVRMTEMDADRFLSVRIRNAPGGTYAIENYYQSVSPSSPSSSCTCVQLLSQGTVIYTEIKHSDSAATRDLWGYTHNTAFYVVKVD